MNRFSWLIPPLIVLVTHRIQICFTHKSVDCAGCCICHSSANFSIRNALQTLFIAALKLPKFVELPTFRPPLLVTDLQYLSHENEVNIF